MQKKSRTPKKTAKSATTRHLIKSKTANPTQTKINQLWQKIQQQKQAITDFETQLTQGLTLYQTLIIPVQKDHLLPAQIALLERLMALFERKTLADWQRDLMVTWMSELQTDIEHIDSEQGRRLHQQMLTLMQKVSLYKVPADQQQDAEAHMQAEFARLVQDMTGEDIPAPEGGWNFENIGDTIEKYQQSQRFSKGDNGFEAEDENIDHAYFQQKFAKNSTKNRNNNAEEFEIWLNQMFRRTAKVLHPDKQPEGELRDQNEALMARLSYAKEQQDIATIIELYMTHAGDNVLADMAELDEKHLVKALAQQLDALKYQYKARQQSSVLTDYALKRLQKASKDPKEQQKWLKEIQHEAKQCEITKSQLKSLSKLKGILETMWEQEHAQELRMRAMMMEEMFGEGFEFYE